METSRIDNLFELASKNAAGKAAPKHTGFANLLLDAMGPWADSTTAEPIQIKSAHAVTIQPLSNRPVINATQADDQNMIVSFHDPCIDSDQDTASCRSEDGKIVRAGGGADRPAIDTAHASPGTEVVVSAGCDPRNDIDTQTVDTVRLTDGASDSDQDDGGQDLALGIDDDNEPGTENDNSSGKKDDLEVGLVFAVGALPIDAAVRDTDHDTLAGLLDAAPVIGDETKPVADGEQAGTLAAAAKMQGLANIGADSDTAMPQPGSDGAAPEGHMGSSEVAASGLTFKNPATLARDSSLQGDGTQPQSAAIKAEGERSFEDNDNLFRRSPGNGRRVVPVGSGAVAAAHDVRQNSGTQATPGLHSAIAASGGYPAGNTTAAGYVGPGDVDTGLATPTDLPGWNIHLAQGTTLRRPDFLAALRQHLQNLPVHEQLALSIQRSMRNGGGTITLQLSPAELGRVNVRLRIDEENNVQVTVAVERPSTLELLQRDMKALERALQEAGLKAGPGDLSFSLQGGDPEAFAREFGGDVGPGSGNRGGRPGGSAEDTPATTPAAVIATGDGLVDMQV